MMLMQVASALVYFISVILLREYFDLHYLDFTFVLKVCFITLVSWLPFQIVYYLINIFDPSDNQKVTAAKEEME